MALAQINPVQSQPKTSKLETALKYAGLAMDMGKMAGSIAGMGSPKGGQIMASSTLPSTMNLNAGTPSSPMGSASLYTPDELQRRLRALNTLGNQ